jgi:hypothetical protein
MRACSILALIVSVAALALAPATPLAQQTKETKQTKRTQQTKQAGQTRKPAAVRAGKGEKVCRVRLQYTGEVRRWVCRKEEPCCVWHEINYVKCGSTMFGCL